MRRSSEILIFINIQKALDAGIKFYLSDNGVVLTEGDERGFLGTEFFDSVEDAKARRNQAKRLKDGKGSEEIVGDVPLTTP
jgi:2'-phosphotransferase